jgi:glycosyltransferase involved in cell wall biosynthesis
LLKNNGKGFNTNFKNALKNMTGDIIFICDQDDVWLEDKIEKVITTFD